MTTYEYVLEVKDKASRNLLGVGRSADSAYSKIHGQQTKTQKLQSNLNTQFQGFNNILGKIGLGIGIGAMVSGFKNLGKQIFNVRREIESYEITLKNTLQSGGLANLAMNQITQFAAKTPFQVQELTSAYVKLANRGMKPSMKEMTKLGDVASYTGKTFDMLTEAILDAATGEFERLKEFGIVARASGDKVKFTFRDQTVEVNKSASAIKKYILGLGDLKGVMGSMAKQSEGLTGQFSNLKDSWSQLLNTWGQDTQSTFSETISALNTFIKEVAFRSKSLQQIRSEWEASLLEMNINRSSETIDSSINTKEAYIKERERVVAEQDKMKEMLKGASKKGDPYQVKEKKYLFEKENPLLPFLSVRVGSYNKMTTKYSQSEYEKLTKKIKRNEDVLKELDSKYKEIYDKDEDPYNPKNSLNFIAGNSKPTTINITVGKLQDQTVINSETVTEGVSEIERMLMSTYLKVINSANKVAFG